MFREDLLQDQRILITGGGSGLGAAMAMHFAGLGASLVLCGRREDMLRKTAEDVPSRVAARRHRLARWVCARASERPVGGEVVPRAWF